jgi:SAM-dependent methyltransferase
METTTNRTHRQDTDVNGEVDTELKSEPDTEAIREAVRTRYARAAEGGGCCDDGCCGGSTAGVSAEARGTVSTSVGYSQDELASVPEGADLGLGCGNPVGIASLVPGETVLDLGSGGGLDCFLAAERVGPEGHVIGVDMTPEMIARARRNATAGGHTNVEFRLGEIEALPVADASVDAILSNCVLNLSPERGRVLEEALRVLRPGGRVVISDLVSNVPVPPALAGNLDAVAACLPVPREQYMQAFVDAGFTDVNVVDEHSYPGDSIVHEAGVEDALAGASEATRAELDLFAASIRGVVVQAFKR